MLVLSRQRDETIMIGDDIEITVVDIRGDKVRLGISAPTSIAVHRKEVYEAIRNENERAAQLQNGELRAIAPGEAARPASAERRSQEGPRKPVAIATPVHPAPAASTTTPSPRDGAPRAARALRTA